jgi:hypothetical protein
MRGEESPFMTHTSTKSGSGTAPAAAANQPLRLKPVLNGIFRANPSYELLSFDRLPAEQQELFFSLKSDPNFYGVLRPREGSQLPLKSACRDTALLFLSLQAAGKLPAFVASAPELSANRDIAALVLDGVLEIEHENEMLLGAAALNAICEPPETAGPEGELSRLSGEALLYAQSLPFQDASRIAARLYSYGRIPQTTTWQRKFPDEQAVRRCLGVHDGARNTASLAGHWTELPADPENDGWIFWQRRRNSMERRTETYKLYLSPHPSFLGEAFDALVAEVDSGGALAFKVGRNLAGVLRPDKIIAYFSRFDQVQNTAERILARLDGCAAQGVPFTAQIDRPLVSWGIDPPEENDMPTWLARQSWRLWVVNRLAVALLTARNTPGRNVEPWKFAMDRLSLEGVDPSTWTPIRKEEN